MRTDTARFAYEETESTAIETAPQEDDIRRKKIEEIFLF
jgi:hypothetical protein